MTDPNDEAWFLPKAIGIGSGLPIAWQGWALLLGYVAFVGGVAVALLPRHGPVFMAVTVIATIAFSVIAARHTRGGWRWRWRWRSGELDR